MLTTGFYVESSGVPRGATSITVELIRTSIAEAGLNAVSESDEETQAVPPGHVRVLGVGPKTGLTQVDQFEMK